MLTKPVIARQWKCMYNISATLCGCAPLAFWQERWLTGPGTHQKRKGRSRTSWSGMNAGRRQDIACHAHACSPSNSTEQSHTRCDVICMYTYIWMHVNMQMSMHMNLHIENVHAYESS